MTINLNRLIFQILLNLRLKWKTYAMLILIALVILTFHYFNKDFRAAEFISSRISNTQLFNTTPDIDINKFHFKWFPQFILFLSCVITSLSFSEYSNSTSRTFYLSLPSSTLEKWLAKVIIALVVIPLSLTFMYQVFIWLSQLWPQVDEYYQVPVHVFDPFLWPNILTTILLQGIFFAFSIWFKKWSLAKAILAMVVVASIYNIVMILSIILLNSEQGLNEDLTIQSLTSIKDFINGTNMSTSVKDYMFFDVFFRNKYVLSFLSTLGLLLSYIKFKEMES